MRPHRRQPTRLPRPWDSPGKNTGVCCHFLLQCMKVNSESEVAQSCLTLATPWTAAPQAPLSMGFSRQKYWSGVPLPSPLFAIPCTGACQAPLFIGILQSRILEWVAMPSSIPTQGWNPGLLYCRQIFYHLSHQGSPNPDLKTGLNRSSAH